MTNFRKNPFKQLLLLSLVLMVGFSFNSCKKEKKDIGVQLYSVRDAMNADPRGTVDSIGKIGYTFVEAAGYGEGKFYGMEPAVFKALVDSNGMQFLSSHTGQNLPDSASWDKTMAWWDQAIAAHKDAGVKYIVQPWMDSVGYASLAGLKRYCDYFNAVGEKCNAAGIKFGYHNHDKEFSQLDSTIIYDFMLKNTDSTKVMFQLDLYWITKGGKKPVDYFNNYPGRFILWHVKDEKELGAKASSIMDFKPIFEGAEKSGMKHIIVEVERYDFDPIQSVRMSWDFLNKAEYVK